MNRARRRELRLPRRGASACATAAGVLAAAALLGGCDKATTLGARVGLVPFEKVCAKQLPPTRVAVTTEPLDYTVDATRSYRELTAMSPDAGSYDRALGLTLTEVGYSSDTELQGIEEKSGGRECVRPLIRIALAMKPMRVFVASEYHGDACREAVILEHERKHVAVYADFIALLARELRDAVTAEFGDEIFYAADRAQAEREITQRLAVHLDPLVRDSMRRIKERQKVVDSPEEYARVAAACGGMKND
jgi:hypothetical protein